MAFLVISLLCFSAWASGPLRAITGFRPETTFGIALLASFLGCYVLYRFKGLFRPRWLPEVTSFLFVLGLFLFAVLRLYNPIFGGLVSVGGGDAGDHIYYKDLYGMGQPQIYNSMVGFHAFAYWIEKIFGLNSFQSFRLVFYFTILVLFFLWAYSIRVGATNHSKQLLIRLYIIGFIIALYPLEHLLLPTLHYLQADGYYPQLFGLIPLFLTWVAYASAETFLERVLVAGVSVILYRYTYGLNLGDLLLTFGFLLASDPDMPNRRRWLGYILFAGAAALAYEVYRQVLPLIYIGGQTVSFDYKYAILGSALLALALLYRREAIPESGRSSQLGRIYLFAGIYGLVSTLIQMSYLSSGHHLSYYFFKYNFHPLVLVSFATMTAAIFAIEEMISAPRKFRWPTILFLTAGVIGFFFLFKGYQIYRASYKERVGRGTGFTAIQPLADLEAWELIDHVLQSENRAFGGYISQPRWALAAFMNAGFGRHRYNKQPLYRIPTLNMSPGRCVFWSSGADDLEQIRGIRNGKAIEVIEELTRDYNPTRVEYTVRWQTPPKALSYACFEKRSERVHSRKP